MEYLKEKVKKHVILDILSDQSDDKLHDSHRRLRSLLIEQVAIGRDRLECTDDSIEYFFLRYELKGTCSSIA